MVASAKKPSVKKPSVKPIKKVPEKVIAKKTSTSSKIPLPKIQEVPKTPTQEMLSIALPKAVAKRKCRRNGFY